MLLRKADRTVKIINIFTCHFTEFDRIFDCEHLITAKNKVCLGNSELLELRLLETGFLSRFQLNP